MDNKPYSRLQWTPQEQNTLRELKQNQHILSWKIISKIINQMFPKNWRTGKQCRERYTNYVKFRGIGANMAQWTNELDLLLLNKFVYFGPKWVKIANFLTEKSQNCLKNRFYGMIRKIVRKIKNFHKQKHKKMKKIMSTEYLIKILSSNLCTQMDSIQFLNFQTKLKSSIIRFATNPHPNLIDQQELSTLIKNIEEFSNIRKQLKKNQKSRQQNIQKQRYKQKIDQPPETDKNLCSLSQNSLVLKNQTTSSKSTSDQSNSTKQKIVQNIIIKSPHEENRLYFDMNLYEIIPVIWVPFNQNIWWLK